MIFTDIRTICEVSKKTGSHRQKTIVLHRFCLDLLMLYRLNFYSVCFVCLHGIRFLIYMDNYINGLTWQLGLPFHHSFNQCAINRIKYNQQGKRSFRLCQESWGVLESARHSRKAVSLKTDLDSCCSIAHPVHLLLNMRFDG